MLSGKKKSENCDRFNRKSSNDKEQIKKNVDYWPPLKKKRLIKIYWNYPKINVFDLDDLKTQILSKLI